MDEEKLPMLHVVRASTTLSDRGRLTRYLYAARGSQSTPGDAARGSFF